MADAPPEFIPESTTDDAVQVPAMDLANRRHQIWPVFSAAELRRLERFGHHVHLRMAPASSWRAAATSACG